MENLIFNQEYRYWSVIIFVCGLLWWKYQPTSGFFVPKSLIVRSRWLLVQTVSWLLLLCLSLLPLDLAVVQSRSFVSEPTVNIQIVYDVSISMAATDILPSRFEAGKQALMKLVEQLEGYHTSLIAFAQFPVLHFPFTDHSSTLYQALGDMTFADFPPTEDFQGTAIGDALLLAIKHLSDEAQTTKKQGIIILMTDGDSQMGIDPSVATDLARQLEIPIYTLALGQDEVDVGRLSNGQKVVAKLNIPLLQNIASDTSGTFYRIFKADDFLDVFSDIESMVKEQEKTRIVYQSFPLNNVLILFLMLSGSFLLYVKVVSRR